MDMEKGFLKRIADSAGVSQQFLCDLRAKRKRASPDVAERLEAACRAHGVDVPRADWANPQWSDNEFFRAEK